METKAFSTLYVSRLPINDLYALTRSTIEYAAPVRENLSDLIGTALTQMETANTAIEQAVNFAVTDTFVDLFNEMDELRKKYAMLINRKDEEEEAPAETAGV